MALGMEEDAKELKIKELKIKKSGQGTGQCPAEDAEVRKRTGERKIGKRA